MSKISVPIEGSREDADSLVKWLNERGHSATVGSDSTWYIDGVNILDDEAVNNTVSTLCDEYRDSFPPEFNQCENPETRFDKEDGAAENWLLEVADKLLTGEKIHTQSRIALGQALREAALTGDGVVLMKELGLKKGGGKKQFEQAARTGVSNQELAKRFNVGKNETPKKRAVMKDAELDELNRRLSHTVGVLLRAIEQKGKSASIHQVAAHMRDYLEPQFRMLESNQLEDHVNKAIKRAVDENLITSTGSTITRNI